MVADFACGSGVGLVTMAKAFPKSTFYGWDISNIALGPGPGKRNHGLASRT